jgi:hypothetical protein
MSGDNSEVMLTSMQATRKNIPNPGDLKEVLDFTESTVESRLVKELLVIEDDEVVSSFSSEEIESYLDEEDLSDTDEEDELSELE